ncbi:MAG: hypothetical protein L0H24_14785, partial [Microlunatus sp.]|nr:hypothetical protein [Microlunatus sp.]
DHDRVVTRAYGGIGGILEAPPYVFADPLTQQRLAPYVHGPRYSPSGPTRADLLNATGQESP